jgi:hypothetical protein
VTDANDRSPVSMTWAARLTSALTAWWTCAGVSDTPQASAISVTRTASKPGPQRLARQVPRTHTVIAPAMAAVINACRRSASRSLCDLILDSSSASC